ncbi:unnamed protein product [Phytophthora fragariaefolia]|uniref:Unnamed protein product n=1 Tax=Phytophthora fragariaefolia TaxID=1490495 RepID=A0A9W6XA59_9STRA|nr:unnamed protein product [Phytophthora fragariaefolia]
MSLLVYAKTEAEYAKHFKYIIHLASVVFTNRPGAESSVGHQSGRDGHDSGQVEMNTLSNDGSLANEEPHSEQHPLVVYFEKNWDNCRELWCAYKRQHAVTLGNNTNNRLESSWKQLKKWVDSFMVVDECIASIILSDATPLAEPFAVRRVLDGTDRPWGNNRKYREALPNATEICDTMAGLGMPQYQATMNYLQQVARQFKNGDLGTVVEQEKQTGELGTLSGELSGATQLSTQVTEMRSVTVELSMMADMPSQTKEIRSGSVELRDTAEVQTHVESEESRTVLEPVLDMPFEIASPPRSRGRPKRSAKAEKAARNLSVAAASDDSDLYASHLSLASVNATLSSKTTYDSAVELLSKFRIFEYGVKFRAPTVRKRSNLPPIKPVVKPESIFRIRRPEYIEMCSAKVSALQAKTKGLAEGDVVLDIIGLGVYSTETLNIMKRWYRAMEVIKNLNKGIECIDTIHFTIPVAASFRCSADTDLLFRIKEPLLCRQRNQLSDTTINIVMERLFRARPDVMTVDPAVIGPITSHCTTILPGWEDIFVGLSTEKVLIPICCNNQHWCSIMIDLVFKEVCIYDPVSSSGWGTTDS